MSKIPAHGWKEAVRILESEGFELVRQRGDHLVYWKQELLRPVIVPKYKELPMFVIQNIIKTSKIGRKKYLKYLSPNLR